MARRRRRGGGRKPRLGTGKRFRRLQGSLRRRGARNPAALAAYIGRKKYGRRRFAQLSARGRRRAAGRRRRGGGRRRRR